MVLAEPWGASQLREGPHHDDACRNPAEEEKAESAPRDGHSVPKIAVGPYEGSARSSTSLERVERLISAVSVETPNGSASTFALSPHACSPNASTAYGSPAHPSGEEGRLRQYIAEATDILDRIQDDDMTQKARLAMLQTTAQEGESLVASMLYADFVASLSEVLPNSAGAVGQRSCEDLHVLIDEGVRMLSQVPLEEALSVLNTVHRAARTSPLASIIYLHMLLSAPGSMHGQKVEVGSPMQSSRSRAASPITRSAASTPNVKVAGSTRVPSPAPSPNQLKTSTHLRENLGGLLSDCRVGLQRLVLSLSRRPSASVDEAEDKAVDDTAEALKSLIREGEALLSNGLPEDMADIIIDTIQGSKSPLASSIRKTYNAQLPRVVSPTRAKKSCRVIHDLTSPSPERPRHVSVWRDTRLVDKMKKRGSLSGATEYSRPKALGRPMSLSYRTQFEDPDYVSLIGKKDGARAPCDNRDADAGVGLSKQFEGLRLRASALQQRIAYLDGMNDDPFKVGSRAWRMNRRLPPIKSSPPAPIPRDGNPTGPTSPISRTSTKAENLAALKSITVAAARRVSAPVLTEEEKAGLNALANDPVAIAAVITIQRGFRGLQGRSHYRRLAHAGNTAVNLVLSFRKLKISEINIVFRKTMAADGVTHALNAECTRIKSIVLELELNEKAELAKAQREARLEFERLKESEAKAYRELAEADLAQELMDKEKGEMLMWKQRSVRAWETFLETKHEHGLQDGSSEDNVDEFRENYPEVFKAYRQAHAMKMRYEKENEEYEEALRDLLQERKEADKAIAFSEAEQALWKETNDKAYKEQRLLEAHEMARKFTDPGVSIKERFRALSKSNAEAKRQVLEVEEGKTHSDGGNMQHVGVIDGVTPRCKYAGDFCIVQDVDEDNLHSAYSSALDGHEGLTPKTLTDAMSHVGRRLNDDEANRLVKSFDTDGNGTIDFEEFKEGFQRMVGMELPHGYGVEMYHLSHEVMKVATRHVTPNAEVPADHHHHAAVGVLESATEQRQGQGLNITKTATRQDSFHRHHESVYEGEIFEDKRFGVGRYTAPSGYWYLGPWVLGLRHGLGIEGLTHHEDQVPVAVVSCENGRRKTFDRFDPDNKMHRKMLRKMCTAVDTAQKRARKALRLVDDKALAASSGFFAVSVLHLGDSKTRVGLEAARHISDMRAKFEQDGTVISTLSSPEERLERARRHYHNFKNIWDVANMTAGTEPDNPESGQERQGQYEEAVVFTMHKK